MARSSRPEVVQCWQERIAEQTSSGMSVLAYCQLHGIHPSIRPYNYYFWRRKLAALSAVETDRAMLLDAMVQPHQIGRPELIRVDDSVVLAVCHA